MIAALTKRALIRREGYPVGVPAPCDIHCGCGAVLEVDEDGAECACGYAYDARGLIIRRP